MCRITPRLRLRFQQLDRFQRQPVAGYRQLQPRQSCDVVLLRATYNWTVVTPLLSWFLVNMANSQHLLSATTAFRNEPIPLAQAADAMRRFRKFLSATMAPLRWSSPGCAVMIAMFFGLSELAIVLGAKSNVANLAGTGADLIAQEKAASHPT